MGVPRSITVALAVILAVAAPAVTPAATDHAWLIVVDDLHVSFAQTGRLRTLLRAIATELIEEGDRYVFRANGPSAARLSAGALIDDRDLAASAIKVMTGNGLKDTDIPVNEVLYRANIALDAAVESMSALTSDASPRQAMVYVSNGYDIDTFPALADRVSVWRRAREQHHDLCDRCARLRDAADSRSAHRPIHQRETRQPEQDGGGDRRLCDRPAH